MQCRAWLRVLERTPPRPNGQPAHPPAQAPFVHAVAALPEPELKLVSGLVVRKTLSQVRDWMANAEMPAPGLTQTAAAPRCVGECFVRATAAAPD